MSENLKEWIKDIGLAVIIAVIILQFVRPTIVKEHSMENTLMENDYLFISRKAYTWFGDVQRGDIVVFQSDLTTTKGMQKKLIKRVIGLPGDTVAIHGGWVYLNGNQLDEPYTKDGYTSGEMEDTTVPDGCLFCLGDNRMNSADSRDSRIGMVSMDLLYGKAVFRLFPLKKIGSLYE